jgi:hypothetical protein
MYWDTAVGDESFVHWCPSIKGSKQRERTGSNVPLQVSDCFYRKLFSSGRAVSSIHSSSFGASLGNVHRKRDVAVRRVFPILKKIA